MPGFDAQIYKMLVSSGPRLPWIKKYLLETVWTEDRFTQLSPVPYLNDGEARVNNLEKIIASAADRIYGEFFEGNPLDKNILSFLSNPDHAVVIFDGLSLREIPILKSLARQSRLNVTETDCAFSAIPSETSDFIGQMLQLPGIGPSQLPGRKELTQRRIKAVYLSSNTQSLQVDTDGYGLFLWSAFPDNTYADSGSRFAQHFENICKQLETGWMNTVQQIRNKKKIIITSDHGYIYFGSGMSFERQHVDISNLNEYFGNQRSHSLDNTSPKSGDVIISEKHSVAMIKGRVQTRSTGTAANKLYKHGGVSLMECLTPWLVLECND